MMIIIIIVYLLMSLYPTDVCITIAFSIVMKENDTKIKKSPQFYVLVYLHVFTTNGI